MKSPPYFCPMQCQSKVRWRFCKIVWPSASQNILTLRVKGLVICFYLDWSGSILQIRTNIIKVGSKSWLLTCSSNITLSLPSYTGSALKRELNFCNGYLSLLYFCLWDKTYQSKSTLGNLCTVKC